VPSAEFEPCDELLEHPAKRPTQATAASKRVQRGDIARI